MDVLRLDPRGKSMQETVILLARFCKSHNVGEAECTSLALAMLLEDGLTASLLNRWLIMMHDVFKNAGGDIRLEPIPNHAGSCLIAELPPNPNAKEESANA